MKLLIAYDGSDCARQALDDLGAMGLPDRIDARVLSVADVWPGMPPESFELIPGQDLATLPPVKLRTHALAIEAKSEAEKLCAEAAESIRSRYPQWDVQTETSTESVAAGILATAELWKPDLLLIGSHGKTVTGRLLFGSVSNKIVRYSPCSVHVHRLRATRRPGPLRIILAHDFSEMATAAANALGDRNWPAETQVRVMTAIDTRLLFHLAYLKADNTRSVQERTEDAVLQLRRDGLAAEGHVAQGDPKRVLLAEAEKWDADCIFIGARGVSRVERFLMGSVSVAVVSRAHCPVEVVRPAPATR